MNWKYDKPYEYWNNRFNEQGSVYVAHRKFQNFDQQVELGRKFCDPYIPSAKHALDFGCGVGRFQPWLQSKADQVTAVDFVQSALEIVKQNNPLTETIHYSQLPLPIEDETFDLVWTFTVLQHIVDREAFESACKELNRVACPGAKFILIENQADEAPHVAKRTPDHYTTALDVDLLWSESINIDKPRSHWLIVGEKPMVK
jgi:ubiquinone/menaquinone biosynthesis C-methylase UbiE